MVLMALLIAPAILYAQNSYSPRDLSEIRKARKKEAKAHASWDRKSLYFLGRFHQEIYEKYKDTSMNAAIRCYQRSCFTEGDFMNEEPLMAALQLGNIFETGKGTEKNIGKAQIYYFISDSIGSKHLSRLLKETCPSDSFSFISDNRDSMVIAVNPFCGIREQATINEIRKLADKAGAERYFKIVLHMPDDFYTSYFNYWRRNEAFNRIVEQIKTITGDLSYDRYSIEVRDGAIEKYTVSISIN